MGRQQPSARPGTGPCGVESPAGGRLSARRQPIRPAARMCRNAAVPVQPPAIPSAPSVRHSIPISRLRCAMVGNPATGVRNLRSGPPLFLPRQTDCPEAQKRPPRISPLVLPVVFLHSGRRFRLTLKKPLFFPFQHLQNQLYGLC